MNRSKANDPRSLRKWYESGAIQQPALPSGGLEIDAMGHSYDGPTAGLVTLSLARPEDRKGNKSYAPVAHVIVRPSKRYSLGTYLNHLPGNAMPMSLFFPKHNMEKNSKPQASAETVFMFPKVEAPKKFKFRHGIDTGKYTIVEKDGGWSRDEIGLFVQNSVECESLPRLPNRLVISTIVDRDEVENLIGHPNFTLRHVTSMDRWA